MISKEAAVVFSVLIVSAAAFVVAGLIGNTVGG